MELYKDLLSDISNFALVVFGFCISLYTLFYSFILSKIDLLNELSDNIKLGEQATNKTYKEVTYVRYIKRLKKINSYNILCLWFSLGIYFLSLVIKYFNLSVFELLINGFVYKIYIVYILTFLTFLLLIYIIIILIISIKMYNKNANV